MQKKRGSKDVQEAIRIKVVSYLNKSLGSQKQAAEMFGLSIRSVNRIWASYKTGGAGAVESKKRGVRSGKKINGQQAAEVRRLIKDKMPDQLKLPFGLWTRAAGKEMPN